MLNTHTEDC